MSDTLWDRLAAEGLVEGERPAPGRAASPWYVRVMLGIAGWIGALFLMMAIGTGLAFVIESAGAAITVGALCCAGAFFLFRAFDGGDFTEQFALAISLVGQMLIAYGLSQYLSPEQAPLYVAVAAVELGLAWLVVNFLHRILATGGAAIALALAVYIQELHGLSAPLLCAALAFVWIEPKRWAGQGSLWRPIGYGLVLALLMVETFRLAGGGELLGTGAAPGNWLARNLPLIGRGATAAILVWLAVAICLREGKGPGSRTMTTAVAGALALGLLGLNAPGFASALVILLLGFAAGNRILLAMGVLGLLGFIAHFYYSLHATLLEKSGLLAASGVLLLGAWALLSRGPPAAQQTPAAEESADA